jgi:hypothetical protein
MLSRPNAADAQGGAGSPGHQDRRADGGTVRRELMQAPNAAGSLRPSD